jgi:hypothetical protein
LPAVINRKIETGEPTSFGAAGRRLVAAVVVSERTVHAHVRNVLDKLELDSRVQITTWVLARGLLEETEAGISDLLLHLHQPDIHETCQVSSILARATSAPAHTFLATSRLYPPAKTTTRRSNTRSGSSNGTQLQCNVAHMVCMLLEARVGALSIVGANGRYAYEWRVWHHARLRDGMHLVPGVVDNTTNIIEHPELVAERLVRHASVVGKERVMAGVDCGFATGAGSTRVDERVAWAKLESLVAGARVASDALWGSA